MRPHRLRCVAVVPFESRPGAECQPTTSADSPSTTTRLTLVFDGSNRSFGAVGSTAIAHRPELAEHRLCDVLPHAVRDRWIGGPVWPAPHQSPEPEDVSIDATPSVNFAVCLPQQSNPITVDPSPETAVKLLPVPMCTCQSASPLSFPVDAVRSIGALASADAGFIEAAAKSFASGLDSTVFLDAPSIAGAVLLGSRPLNPLSRWMASTDRGAAPHCDPSLTSNVNAFAVRSRDDADIRPCIGVSWQDIAIAAAFAHLCEYSYVAEPTMAAHPVIVTHVAALASTHGADAVRRCLRSSQPPGLVPIALGRVFAQLGASADPTAPQPPTTVEVAFCEIAGEAILPLVHSDRRGGAVIATGERREALKPWIPRGRDDGHEAVPAFRFDEESDDVWVRVRSFDDAVGLSELAAQQGVAAGSTVVAMARLRRWSDRNTTTSALLTFIGASHPCKPSLFSEAKRHPLRLLAMTLRSRNASVEPHPPVKPAPPDPSFLLGQLMHRALCGRACLYSALIAEPSRADCVDNLPSSLRLVAMMGHPPWESDLVAPRLQTVAELQHAIDESERSGREQLVAFEERCRAAALHDRHKTCTCQSVVTK